MISWRTRPTISIYVKMISVIFRYARGHGVGTQFMQIWGYKIVYKVKSRKAVTKLYASLMGVIKPLLQLSHIYTPPC